MRALESRILKGTRWRSGRDLNPAAWSAVAISGLEGAFYGRESGPPSTSVAKRDNKTGVQFLAPKSIPWRQ